MLVDATGHPAVVLVGDNPDVLGMYQAGLLIDGFTAYIAAPAADIPETFHSVKPDAIVTLLPYPEITGWDLIERLRTDDIDDRSIPVVVLTDHADPDIRARATSLGCAAVLPIPCLPDHLTRVLRRVLCAEQAR